MKTKDRSRRARHYSLRKACAWIVVLLGTLHCPAPDAPPAPETTPAQTTEEPAKATAADERPAIVFLGTSLTAGYGLPESDAYPARIQARIDAAGLDHRVVNAGVSGDTSAGGLRRLDWLLRLPIAVLVLELGANDMLRGQPAAALEANLAAVLERTRAAHPDVRFLVAGMRAAPNLGRDYAEAFDAVYPRIARRFDAAFVPFLLEDVAARPELNQADGIHPTAEGHALIAERVWQALAPLLEKERPPHAPD
ncbi:MAG: arylesterase [Myxococcota bacterium]